MFEVLCSKCCSSPCLPAVIPYKGSLRLINVHEQFNGDLLLHTSRLVLMFGFFFLLNSCHNSLHRSLGILSLRHRLLWRWIVQ